LRADRRTAPIRVVFFTARGEGCEHQRLRALGAAGVIAKPFDPMRLAAEVHRFVAVEGVLSPVLHTLMGTSGAPAPFHLHDRI